MVSFSEIHSCGQGGFEAIVKFDGIPAFHNSCLFIPNGPSAFILAATVAEHEPPPDVTEIIEQAFAMHMFG